MRQVFSGSDGRIYLFEKNPFIENDNEKGVRVIKNLVLKMPSDVDAVIYDENEAERLREEGETDQNHTTIRCDNVYGSVGFYRLREEKG